MTTPRPPEPRRGFFRSLAGEASAFVEEASGVPQFTIDELPQLPDEKLALLVPDICDGVRLRYAGSIVQADLGRERPPATLFRSDSPEMRIFACFDGSRSLADVSRAVAGPGADAAALARSLMQARRCFLRLVRLGVCVPANAAT